MRSAYHLMLETVQSLTRATPAEVEALVTREMSADLANCIVAYKDGLSRAIFTDKSLPTQREWDVILMSCLTIGYLLRRAEERETLKSIFPV